VIVIITFHSIDIFNEMKGITEHFELIEDDKDDTCNSFHVETENIKAVINRIEELVEYSCSKICTTTEYYLDFDLAIRNRKFLNE